MRQVIATLADASHISVRTHKVRELDRPAQPSTRKVGGVDVSVRAAGKLNFFCLFLRAFIGHIVSGLMIRKWSWPDLRSDMVSFGEYERAHNAAVKISDFWPHVYVRNHSGTKQKLCH
jgi:hypothetical protein